MTLSLTLARPLTMSQFLKVDDLAARALAERAKGAAALTKVDALMPELKALAARLAQENPAAGKELDALAGRLEAAIQAHGPVGA